VGKSNASQFFLAAYKFSYITNTYSSMRSIYSNLPCDDFLNKKASYNDEAPAWIPEAGCKRGAPQEKEQIAHLKEKLSSGKMAGDRLVFTADKAASRTMTYNVQVPNAPMVMNTNAPERSGEPPLLERFIKRYFIFNQRFEPHALVKGAPPLPSEVKRGIRREFQLQHMLMSIVSKLQNDGIIAWPCTLVFKSYYERFMQELRVNPWLDCDPPSPADRRSSIIETLYTFFVVRQAVHRLFLAPDAKHAGTPFRVEQLLDMHEEMCTGDIQSAMLAIGTYSHDFRSPTEYRVADLIKSLVLVKLRREYAAEGKPAPASPAAWSRKGDEILEHLCGTDPEERHKFKGDAPPSGERAAMGTRYIPVAELSWGAGTPSKWDACGSLAGQLLDGQPNSSNRVMPDHAQKRLSILATVGARHGADAGFTPVLMHMSHGSRTTHVLVLASWLLDATGGPDAEFSMHSMLRKAALKCSFTAPGTYVTLEPYVHKVIKDNQEVVGAVPSMLPCFEVPVHEHKCPARVEEEETRPHQCYDPRLHERHGCTCFRNKRLAAELGTVKALCDPQVAAVVLFRNKVPGARLAPACGAAPGVYPADCLRQAIDTGTASRGAPRDPTRVELEIMDELRLAAGASTGE